MMGPLVAPSGFLAGAAGALNQLRASVFLLFLGSAIAIGVANAGWPVFRQYR